MADREHGRLRAEWLASLGMAEYAQRACSLSLQGEAMSRSLSAMCGRLRVGKGNLHVAPLVGSSHVFGLKQFT
jgi:hypothetical protein